MKLLYLKDGGIRVFRNAEHCPQDYTVYNSERSSIKSFILLYELYLGVWEMRDDVISILSTNAGRLLPYLK
jgi:hypothetical protein